MAKMSKLSQHIHTSYTYHIILFFYLRTDERMKKNNGVDVAEVWVVFTKD